MPVVALVAAIVAAGGLAAGADPVVDVVVGAADGESPGTVDLVFPGDKVHVVGRQRDVRPGRPPVDVPGLQGEQGIPAQQREVKIALSDLDAVVRASGADEGQPVGRGRIVPVYLAFPVILTLGRVDHKPRVFHAGQGLPDLHVEVVGFVDHHVSAPARVGDRGQIGHGGQDRGRSRTHGVMRPHLQHAARGENLRPVPVEDAPIGGHQAHPAAAGPVAVVGRRDHQVGVEGDVRAVIVGSKIDVAVVGGIEEVRDVQVLKGVHDDVAGAHRAVHGDGVGDHPEARPVEI